MFQAKRNFYSVIPSSKNYSNGGQLEQLNKYCISVSFSDFDLTAKEYMFYKKVIVCWDSSNVYPIFSSRIKSSWVGFIYRLSL